MENNELLNQIAALLEDQTSRMEAKIQTEINQLRTEMREEMSQFERRLNIKIENSVTRRIDVLFDGLALVREKQTELEQEQERTKRQIDEIQTRVTVLESKGVS